MAVLAHDGPDHGAQLGGVLAASAVANEVPVAPAEVEFVSLNTFFEVVQQD